MRNPILRIRSAGDGTIVKRSDGRYKAILRWNDGNGKEVSKTRLCETIRSANLALAEFKRIRDRGGDPRSAKTVGDLIDSWLELKSSEISGATSEQYRYASKHIKDAFGSTALMKLEIRQIDTFLKQKSAEGLSPRYVQLLRTVLSMALEQAIRWKLIDTNPARHSATIRQQRSQSKALNGEQASRLMAAASKDRLGVLWTVILCLGLRRGEALALRWIDFDRQSQTLSITRNRKKVGTTVVFGDLKTANSKRVIPLPDFLVAALDGHRKAQMIEKEHLLSLGVKWADSEAMFTTVRGYYLDPDSASKLFKTLCRRAGIGDWHLHELRHSAATLLLSRGIPLEQVSKILGHASIRITSDVYGHLTTEHLRTATETMGAFLEGLEKPSVSRSVSQKDSS